MRWRASTFECAGLTWSEVESRLASLLDLRAKSDDRYVILSSHHEQRFVQFAHDQGSGSVRCEAISNNFLTGPARLSRATLKALSELGWNQPSKDVPNFWKLFKADSRQIKPAKLAVQTMRNAFGVDDTASLYIVCDAFGTATETAHSAFLKGGTPELKEGQQLVNLTTGQSYRIGGLLGRGGFGAAYRASQTGGQPENPGELCLKISSEPEGWHVEAYFGQLLDGVPRAIAVYSSFAAVSDTKKKDAPPLYCLVTELADHGDLFHYLETRQGAWRETRACREVAALLRVLVRLHEIGAVHRDLTPGNVLVTAGEHLKLGDFGIARQRLGKRAIAADAFNPGFAPPRIAGGDTSSWTPADDVYQMGVILAMLLGSSTDASADADDVKSLECSPAVKVIIQRAIGDRRKRYQDAGAMLSALEARDSKKRRLVRIPASLVGQRVVFTGALSALSRGEATTLVKARGGRVEPKVSSRTDIVVQGSLSPGWKAEDKGQKLLDVDREAERGHHIAVIDEREFMALVR